MTENQQMMKEGKAQRLMIMRKKAASGGHPGQREVVVGLYEGAHRVIQLDLHPQDSAMQASSGAWRQE